MASEKPAQTRRTVVGRGRRRGRGGGRDRSRGRDRNRDRKMIVLLSRIWS